MNKLKQMDKQTINETLWSCPETASTALQILREAGFAEDVRRKAVAEILWDRSLKEPPDFPASRACIAYGTAIANHIIAKEELSPEVGGPFLANDPYGNEITVA